VLAAPALADEGSIELDELSLLVGIIAVKETAGIRPVNDQMRYPFGVPRGVLYRDRPALRHAQQDEALERKAIDNAFEVANPAVH